jgi:hypothetical protein
MDLDVVSCCCEKLVAEAGDIREPRERGTSAVGSRYQATASEGCYGLRRYRVSCNGL